MMIKYRALVVLVALLAFAVAGCGGEKSLDAAGLKLGGDAGALLGQITESLSGISDLQSAQAALPDLQKYEGKLDDIVGKAKDLAPESKTALAGLVKKGFPALESAVQKLGGMEGVGEAIMPTINSILSKIRGLM